MGDNVHCLITRGIIVVYTTYIARMGDNVHYLIAILLLVCWYVWFVPIFALPKISQPMKIWCLFGWLPNFLVAYGILPIHLTIPSQSLPNFWPPRAKKFLINILASQWLANFGRATARANQTYPYYYSLFELFYGTLVLHNEGLEYQSNLTLDLKGYFRHFSILG